LLDNFARENGLSRLETIKKVMIDNIEWADHGLITPVYKSKRTELKKYYDKKLDQLYFN